VPRKPRAAPGWEHYFPIPRGEEFEVQLLRPPLPLRGRGTVVRRTGTALHLRMEMPGWLLVPRIAADVTITYAREGRGNSGRLEVQMGVRRESFVDEDVTIHSRPAQRTREISASLPLRGQSNGAVLCATSEEECRISTRGWVVRVVLARSRS